MYLPEEEGTVSRIGSIGVFGFWKLSSTKALSRQTFGDICLLVSS